MEHGGDGDEVFFSGGGAGGERLAGAVYWLCRASAAPSRCVVVVLILRAFRGARRDDDVTHMHMRG